MSFLALRIFTSNLIRGCYSETKRQAMHSARVSCGDDRRSCDMFHDFRMPPARDVIVVATD